MAQPQVYEGTWEEIKLHHAKFAGHYLRVIVEPKRTPAQETAPVVEQPKRVLTGLGKFKGKLGGTEAYLREKHEYLAREERDW